MKSIPWHVTEQSWALCLVVDHAGGGEMVILGISSVNNCLQLQGTGPDVPGGRFYSYVLIQMTRCNILKYNFGATKKK